MNMAILSTIQTTCPSGRHSLVISLTLLKWWSTPTLPTERQSGWDNLGWCCFSHTAMMEQAQNIQAAELSDFSSWRTLMALIEITATKVPFSIIQATMPNVNLSKLASLTFTRTYNKQTFRLSIPQDLPISSIWSVDKWNATSASRL